ncbi:MAG TPA: hypothetical protein VMO26_28760 [Vicinamibacterales bacterium]|nr:hypothetical protein [Vicinamibacterales bacterium]
MRIRVLIGGLVVLGGAVAARQAINPRQQPGAMVHIFAPEQHDLSDGHFVISANRIYMVGGLNDPEGWDHLDNEAKSVKPVSGTAEIDVDEIQNTGTFEARLKIPEGDLVLIIHFAFHACAFNHSDISPFGIDDLQPRLSSQNANC